MSVYLLNFSDDDLIFDDDETREILTFFFPNFSYDIRNHVISRDLRAFAQGILVESYQGSGVMGWIETLFKATERPNASLKNVSKKLAKYAIKNYAHRWIPKSEADKLLEGKEYEVCVGVIRSNFSQSFRMLMGGLITYRDLSE